MSTDTDALVALMPFASRLGLRIESADAQSGVARLGWAEDLCTAGGILHGGALMALADSLGAVVTFLGLPEGATTATITSSTQMFRPASGDVTARAQVLHRGRTAVTVQTSIYDDAGKLVAQTTQVQAVRQG